jgi:CRP-like cAMP-binding protein
MTPDRIALLQAMPLFGGLSAPTLDFLLSQARTQTVAEGGYFCHEGDAATGLFVLVQGRVAVCRRWQQREIVLHALGAGDCFGEMALLDLQPRSAAVRALAPCQALELQSGDLYALYERDCPQFALLQMNIGRELARRLRIADDLLFTLDVQRSG